MTAVSTAVTQPGLPTYGLPATSPPWERRHLARVSVRGFAQRNIQAGSLCSQVFAGDGIEAHETVGTTAASETRA